MFGLEQLSHLALWAACYITAAVACFAQVAGIDTLAGPRNRFIAAAFAFFTAAAVYLLDRVKLRDSWLDPADAAAHPARFNYLARHADKVRIAIAALVLVAVLLAAAFMPAAAPVARLFSIALPILAVCGVLVYAAKPRVKRPRVKDYLILKNAYVAAGITAFAACVAIAAAGGAHDPFDFLTAHAPALFFSACHLSVRILADAALCDLDDEDADRSHGTHTLPTRLGRTAAWNIAMSVRLALALFLVLIPIGPLHARLAWAVITAASSIGIRLLAPARVRDIVDARFAIEAALVAIYLYAYAPHA